MTANVVVTGMGTINPLGHTLAETWQNALAGVSGIGPISLFDASGWPVQIAGEVKRFSPESVLGPKEARRRDRCEQFAAVAAREAISQANLMDSPIDSQRVGVIVSSAIGGINSLQDTILTAFSENPRRVSPFAIPMLMSNGAASMLAIDYGFLGPCFSIVSACASGIDAIGTAWMMIRSGILDVAVTGATEATITRTGVAAFDRLGAMSRRNDLPPVTPQPFDRERDGLVMGEGAAILVLESEQHALQRQAPLLAEIAGYAATADAYHITAPQENGLGGARAMQLAMQAAGISPEEIGYINAHGTATVLNDLAETRAIKSAFGELAYQIPVSSTKSMTGHMMGATGALETIFCVQACREQIAPPTIHYQNADPECDLDYVPNSARKVDIRNAMNNAFGFGGHNAVLIVKTR